MAFDRRETVLLLVGDFFVLAFSLWTALLLRTFSLPSAAYFELNLIPFLPMFLISLGVFYISGLYEKQTRPIRRVMGTRILGAQIATVSVAAILFFILPLSIAPKTILALYLLVSVLLESLWRFYRMQRELREENRVPALLVGSGHAAEELYEEVQANDRYLIRFLGPRLSREEALLASTEYAPGMNIVLDTRDNELTSTVCSRGFRVRDISSLYEEIFDRVPLEYLDTAQFVDVLTREHAAYDTLKRLFDISLALIGIVAALPFVCIGLALLSASGGNPFFRHERVGKDGKRISILKLRSMAFNDHGDPELQKRNRVTVVGRLLRKSRIDELPQLWNILKGDLSFIGPRPELPTLAGVYEREIPEYWMRHSIQPGLSGWAQIHDYDAPRGGVDVARTSRKLSFDLYYLKYRSFGLDLAIALKTLRALLAFSGT